MGKAYRCLKCNGTEVIWDRAIRKGICPKDHTPLNEYKTEADTPSSRRSGT